MVVTRFCPTPSGQLHHGNLYMALLNYQFAKRCGGYFYVQIDDLASPFPPDEIIAGIIEDLDWIGLCPAEKVLFHSRNKQIYLEMLDKLEAEGWLRIKRMVIGCALAKVRIEQAGKPVHPRNVRASSCAQGVAAWIPFAADPRHVLEDAGITIVRGALGWRHDAFWCCDPKEEAPWLEFDLPRGRRPDKLSLDWWLPLPRQVEVLGRKSPRLPWRRLARACHKPERFPSYHLEKFTPTPDRGPELITFAADSDIAQLRLCFKGFQAIEDYEMTVPPEPEIIPYEDLCNGPRIAQRTVATPLRLFQFGRSASDLVLGTTHVIRGDELVKELDLFVQCFHGLKQPWPILCHVPCLVDANGEKISKSEGNAPPKPEGNAPRIVRELRDQGLTPAQARHWIIANAYSNVKQPTPGHGFAAQMNLLAATVRRRPAQRASLQQTEFSSLGSVQP